MTTDAPAAAPSSEPATAPTTRPSTPLPERLFPVGPLRLAAQGLLAAGVAWLWAIVTYRLWDIHWRVPLNSEDDARLITNLVKNTADQGWWTTNPDLGYPVGQQLYDFPHGGETWQLAILRFLSLFTKSPGLLMNAYFFVGIGVAALAAFLALRHLRFSVGTALIASTALTWLPFRIGHSQWHLFRTSFWWIPLAVVVILWTLHWRERFLRDPDPPSHDGWRATLVWTLRHNLRRRRLLTFAAMVVVLGMSETMTSAFTMTLLALTGLIGAVRRREPTTLVVHGLVVVAIAAVFFVGMTSTLRFVAANGTNAEAGRRDVVEQEMYGLKLGDLLLPDPSHRVEALGEPMREVRGTSRIPSEGGQAIGIFGALGFVGAAVHVLTHGWGGRRRDRRPIHDRDSLRDDVGLIVVLATLVATVSGGAIILSLAGFSQVRVWNRMSLIIGFCSLVYFLTWLEGGWARITARMAATPARDRPWARVAVGTALVALLVGFVIWDGANVRFRPPGGIYGIDYDQAAEEWEADAVYAQAIDEAMPDGAAVFQFPIQRFPEQPPVGQMKDYDHLRGWIHLPPGHLRWSYGAMKGRPDGDWQLTIRDEIGEEGSLPYLVGLGFEGVWVDTFGYDDGGARVVSSFEEILGVEPIVSADRRTWYFDLRPYAERLAAEGQSQEDLAELAQRELGITAPEG